MKQKLLLISVLLLIVLLPTVFAISLDTTILERINNNTLIYYEPSVSNTVNNGTLSQEAGTVTGTITLDTGDFQVGDSSALFGDGDDYVTFGGTEARDWGYVNFTVSMWIDFGDYAENTYLWGDYDVLNTDIVRYCRILNTGNLNCGSQNGAADAAGVTITNPDLNSWTKLTFTYSATGLTSNFSVFINSTYAGSGTDADTDMTLTDDDAFLIGQVPVFAENSFTDKMNAVTVVNYTVQHYEIKEWYALENASIRLPDYLKAGEPDTTPTFSNNKRNITSPLQNAHIEFNITITSSTNVSGYIFAYDNGTGDQFYNTSFQEFDGTETIVNATFNKTIYNISGVTWQWKWFANSSVGVWGVSDTYSLIVSGTTPPTLTINPTNFFNAENTSYFNLPASKTVLLNLTFTDDINLFGFEIDITNAGNEECFYFLNITLNGTIDNVSITLNITNSTNANCVLDGFYTVNITGWDSHTALAISDYKVDTGKDYLVFDDAITISADNALTSKATKQNDKYIFEFTYRTLLTPKTKVFYIESDNILTYKTTGYKAHFVDWVEKKWVDFEGIDGEPIVTKISDYKYRIEYANEDEKVVFNSIGGLNSQSDFYKYYLVNTVVDWIFPTTSPSFFTNNSIVIKLNVSGNYRNETRFMIYNLSHDLIASFNISNNGTSDYFYNHTFSGTFTETPYYVNATHYDLTGFATNSTTLVFVTAFFNVLFYDEISATLLTDTINLEVVGSFFAANFSTTTGKIQVPGWILEEYKLVYTSDNHAIREYYVTFTNITNQTLNLYMLSIGNATEVTFTVQDNSGNELQSATIRLKRYYVLTNSYRTVAMSRTNEEGDSLIDVDFNDAYYQISITYGDFTLETIGSRIISLTRILTMNLIPDPFDEKDVIDGISTSLTFNAITQTFSYVFTDTLGVSRTGILDVIKTTVTTSEKVCSATDTTSSGTLLCVYNITLNPGTYTAKGFIQYNGNKIQTNTKQFFTGLKRDFRDIFGSQGTLFTIMFAGVLGGLGATISPAVALVMFMVGIAIASFMGMSILSIAFLVFLVILMVFIIFKMKR